MKKILLAAAFLIGICSNTAKANSPAKGMLNTNDTLSTATSNNYSKNITGQQQTVTFQVDVVKISGTVAGTISWQRSIDGGTKYFTVATSTITDGTAQYSYAHTPSTADDYRVVVTNATGSFSYKVYYLNR